MNYEKELDKLADYSNPLDKRKKSLEKLQEANDVKEQSILGSTLGAISGTALGTLVGLPLGRLVSKLYKKPIVDTVNKRWGDKIKNAADDIIADKDVMDDMVDLFRRNGKETPASVMIGAGNRLQRSLANVAKSGKAAQEDWIQDYSGLVGGSILGGLGALKGMELGGKALGTAAPGTEQAALALEQLYNEQDPKKRAILQQQLTSHFKQLKDLQGSNVLSYLASIGVSMPLALTFAHPNVVKKALNWMDNNPKIANQIAKTQSGKEMIAELGGDAVITSPVAGLVAGGVTNMTSDYDKYQNPF